jgi:sugar lactone lactonase YvrE
MRSRSAPASTRALGGDHGGTLYLCTAPAPGFAEHERRDTREARLVAVEVEVAAA